MYYLVICGKFGAEQQTFKKKSKALAFAKSKMRQKVSVNVLKIYSTRTAKTVFQFNV